MLRKSITTLTLVATAAATMAMSGIASAQGASPTGVWIDHTGRGAVEISDCNGALCGHIVWVKDSKHLNTCRNQVLGNVKAVGGNTWDRGWIVDPDDDKRYSVELKPIGNDRLRVMGYMGSKLFSETMTWKRAPADLKRCDGKGGPETTPAAAPVPAAPAPTREATLTPAPVAPGSVGAPQSPAPYTAPAPYSPNEPAAIEPRRQAAAPAVISPEQTTRPAPVEPQSAAQSSVRPSQNRTAEVEVLPPAVEPDEPPARGGKRKAGNRTCKVELPYITLNYPCDAF